jgi:Protein of unknown function (DUF3349)
MALPPVLSKIVDWLRAGYPEGVPDVDYVPLFALLGSQLTEAEVHAIALELENESKPESAEAIRRAITAVTADGQPSDADIARVRARLAAGGWPLARPEWDPKNPFLSERAEVRRPGNPSAQTVVRLTSLSSSTPSPGTS